MGGEGGRHRRVSRQLVLSRQGVEEHLAIIPFSTVTAALPGPWRQGRLSSMVAGICSQHRCLLPASYTYAGCSPGICHKSWHECREPFLVNFPCPSYDSHDDLACVEGFDRVSLTAGPPARVRSLYHLVMRQSLPCDGEFDPTTRSVTRAHPDLCFPK